MLDFKLSDKYESLLPEIENIGGDAFPINNWVIDQTIGELSYLTHGFFRYYGKFPSTVASQLLEQFPAPHDGILIDNFSGSGTSLVEASRRGIKSIGIDVNPLSILAGKVKTTIYKSAKLQADLKLICDLLEKKIDHSNVPKPDENYLEKWFFDETVHDLVKIKGVILELRNDIEIDFFALAFLAIIRRTSKAFDGEVRPHINKKKNIRLPVEAFVKKAKEMINSIIELGFSYPGSIAAETYLFDNRSNYISHLPKGNYWLAISHPPYLNCFDYLPVYKLELNWAEGFDWLWYDLNQKDLRSAELKSWPAKDDLVVSYYEGLKQGYQNLYDLQEAGGVLAIVIGDCTIKGKLEPVHKNVITMVESIGYKTIELNYRTTHYSTGKYSYQDRANYHGEGEEKKDAIMIFQK